MIPTAFEYERATSVDDALAKLRGQRRGKLIAGGHSLVPLMKLRLASRRCSSTSRASRVCRAFANRTAQIEVGAATVHHDVATSALLRQQLPDGG